MNKEMIRTILEGIIQDNKEYIEDYPERGSISEYIFSNENWHLDFLLGDDELMFNDATDAEKKEMIKMLESIVSEYDHGEGFHWDKTPKYFNDLLSASELADKVGKSQELIRQLTQELLEKGLARKVGKITIFHSAAIEYISLRPDRRKKTRR